MTALPRIIGRLLLAVALGASLTTSCTTKSKDSGGSGINTRPGTLAPDFYLTDANGNILKLSDYRGKTVLLNFWATWCTPCRVEIPWLTEFEEKYKDRGFAVIGLSMDEQGWQVVRPYVARAGINYRLALGNESLVQRYGVERPPATFIIDRRGTLVSAHLGLFNKAGYEEEIRHYLGEGQGTP
jgi:peroxiredoxin